MFGRKLMLIVVLFSSSIIGCREKPVANRSIPPGPYVVATDDNLSQVALRAYGDMNLWSALLNANKQLTTRPNFTLQPGETLEIPEKSKLDRSLPKSVFPKELPADYIVMPGDSLHFIAKGCYGDRDLWLVIYEANRNVLSEAVKQDTRRLIAGQLLHIPMKPTEQEAAKIKEATNTGPEAK